MSKRNYSKPEFIDKLPENVFEIKYYDNMFNSQFNRYWFDVDNNKIIMKPIRGKKFKIVHPMKDKYHESNFVHLYDIDGNKVFIQNIINLLKKFIKKKLTNKLHEFFDEYIDYNDCDIIDIFDLTNIVNDINKYLNNKFEPLFDGISSKEFNDNFGSFDFYGIDLFEKFDDSIGFNLKEFDLIEILNDSEFEAINKMIQFEY